MPSDRPNCRGTLLERQATLLDGPVGRGSDRSPEAEILCLPGSSSRVSRPAALGARTPWYRTRFRRGGGTRAASFSSLGVGSAGDACPPQLNPDAAIGLGLELSEIEGWTGGLKQYVEESMAALRQDQT